MPAVLRPAALLLTLTLPLTMLTGCDKARELYFYCEGLACSLSSDSAAKAVRLG